MKALYIAIRNRLLSLKNGAYDYAATFTGTGLNDATFAGSYLNNIISDTFTITIGSTGTPNKFSWTCASGGSGTNIPMNGSAQYLTRGIFITFAATTGHNTGDVYTFTATAPAMFLFVQNWNNNLDLEMKGKTYDFPKPAALIEIETPTDAEQLGNGVQIFDPVNVRVHYLQDFFNATDGNGDQDNDLTIFDILDAGYTCLQKFLPDGATEFIRSSQEQDFSHGNVYHAKQTYKTNYIDNIMQEPVNSAQSGSPINLEIDIVYSPPPFTKG